MAEPEEDVRAELDLEALFGAPDPNEDVVVKQEPVPGAVTRQGQVIFKGVTRCGKLGYFLHWTPPAYCVSCEIHGGDCYVTVPLMGLVTEDQLVQWLANATSFRCASDRLKTLPAGCYQHPRYYYILYHTVLYYSAYSYYYCY